MCNFLDSVHANVGFTCIKRAKKAFNDMLMDQLLERTDRPIIPLIAEYERFRVATALKASMGEIPEC